MTTRLPSFVSLLACASLALAQTAEPGKESQRTGDQPGAANKHPRVKIETSLGNIIVELDAEKAPITVENFLKYVDEKFYDGTIFHRIIPSFMIQGGGSTSLTEQKTQGLHSGIQNEAKNGLSNTRGTIAMARTGEPHSATSQFFINVVDNSAKLDPPQGGGWGYCVFGKVVEGMDAVDKIKAVPTKPGGENSQPTDPPKITSVRRVDAEARPARTEPEKPKGNEKAPEKGGQ